LPLSVLTDNWGALLLAASEFAVASIESYKTFLTGGRPPGKFAGKPVRAHLPALRSHVAHQHAVRWIAAAVAFAVTLIQPHHGFAGTSARVVPPEVSSALLAAIAVGTATLGTIVIYTSRRAQTPATEPRRVAP
jgi:hypothetical protein